MIRAYVAGTLMVVGGVIAGLAGIWLVLRMMEKNSDAGGEPLSNWMYGAFDIWLIAVFRHWRIKDDGMATGVFLIGAALLALGVFLR